MDDQYLDLIRKLTFNAMAQGGQSPESVAYAMAQGVANYLNKVAEIEGRLPSFSAKHIEQSAIVSDGSRIARWNK